MYKPAGGASFSPLAPEINKMYNFLSHCFIIIMIIIIKSTKIIVRANNTVITVLGHFICITDIS